MTVQPALGTPYARDFVAMIREALDAAGRPDVRADALWIDDDITDVPLILNVPVGPDLVLPVRPCGGFASVNGELDRHVDMFVKALINLKHAEATLGEYAEEIRKAAREQIAQARAEGLELMLDGIDLKPTNVFYLTWDEWRDAADHVLAAVRVRRLSHSLRFEIEELWVEDAEVLEQELERIKDEQREREHILTELVAAGADARVDSITLDLLRAHGLDVAQALRQICKGQSIKVDLPDMGGCLLFRNINGWVSETAHFGQVKWNGEHLWFGGENEPHDLDGLVGNQLGDRVADPTFARLRIAAVTAYPGAPKFISFEASSFLIDAQTGRIWQEERMPAKAG